MTLRLRTVMVALLRLALVVSAGLGLAPAAMAQSSFTFSQTTTGNIDGGTTCTAPLVRNFSVTNTFTVADVNIGVLATHTWRGDLQITLQSPDGTRVQLVNGDIDNIDGDNFNVLLDDAAAQVVNTDSLSGNHAITAPPYQNTFRPNNALTAFNGGPSNGTWRLEICDLFPTADDGSFRRADLILTAAPAADLSLSKSLIGTVPAGGGSVTWRLTVSNAASSALAADGVVVTDILPAGFVFGSASGTGTFNSATGVWTAGSIPVGQSRSIDITGTINASAGATITNTAEITASSAIDNDSTPGNGITTEDDFASVSFTVAGARVAGIPPTLICPAGNVLFDWDPLSWAAGSTSNSYPLSTLGSIGFALTNPGLWLNNAALGGQSPNLQTIVNGGILNQKSLVQLVDLPDRSARVVTTITLPKVMQGAQFRIYDLDFGANQFADVVTVEGRLAGANVAPTLTNGVANYVIANSAYGDAAANNDSADGTVVATFSGPIDTIIIRYGNHTLAPINPGQQAISLSDITFCHPITTLNITKASTVISDPVNGTTNPKAMPGALMEYCVTVSNTGTVSAATVIATDTLPLDTTYVAGSLRTGTNCSGATTAEDDDNTGADETDPFGASFAAGTVIGLAPDLPASQSFAFRFRATVN
ncbi:proprotein convertase P-domain-containing protein [Altererythrobacter sp. H2]|uniref:proprotein convertase P-domain-containing protein n=1 Tax=Altererythrobacter sp. H2 TaxID=3108391 RepID=UPI002B4C0940|nr:proprotein convertase P-domain-containing protein [Altererythrobacter sp. H2]WRK94295.1 proprotein convertase P-domain-containing protein [Altererythrobacter sp. H2]